LAGTVKDKDRNEVFSVNSFVGTALLSLVPLQPGYQNSRHHKKGQTYFYSQSFIIFAILGLAMTVFSFFASEEGSKKKEGKKAPTKVLGKFLIAANLNGFGIALTTCQRFRD